MKTALLLWVFGALVVPQWAIPGGVEKIDDLRSKEVLGAARAAVDRINKASNSIYETLLVDVIHGTQQVVAGKKYVLTILVGRSTDCRKDQERETTDRCHIGGTNTWTATVVYTPWLSPEYKVISLERGQPPGERKEEGDRHVVGAPVRLNDLQHDKWVLGAAETAVTELNKMSNALFKTVLVDIVEGTSQVVNGVKYTLTLLVGRSDCWNDGQSSTLEECPVELGTVERWEAVVWQHSISLQYDILALNKLP